MNSLSDKEAKRMRLTRSGSRVESALGHDVGSDAPRPSHRGRMITAGLASMALRTLLLFGKFALIIVLAKWTDASTVGIYALIVTIATMAVYVIGLELHTYTSREILADPDYSTGPSHVQHHFLTVLLMYAATVPVTGLLMAALGIWGKFSFILFALVLVFEALAQELGRYLMILERPVFSNLLQFVRGAAWIPVAVALILWGGHGRVIDFVLFSWMLGGVASTAFGLWNIRQWLLPKQNLSITWLPSAFDSARHYFTVALLTQVQYYSDRFIVQWMLGTAQVGVMSFYQSFSTTMVTFVQTGVISVLLPRLIVAANQGDSSGEERLRRAMYKWASMLALGIAISLAIFMPFMLRFMGKDAYLQQLPVMYVLLLGNVVLVVGLVTHLALYARKRDAELMRVSLVIIPLGLIANLVAVPACGLMGAAIVFCAIASLDLAVKWRLLHRQ